MRPGRPGTGYRLAPLSKNPHLEPRFPDGARGVGLGLALGGFVTFAYGAVGRHGRHPIEGAIRGVSVYDVVFPRSDERRGGAMTTV